MGECIQEQALACSLKNLVGSMLLWNTYAAVATGISMIVLNCREHKRGVKKRTGFSHTLIQVNNEVHTTLVVDDQHHPQMILHSCHFPFLNQMLLSEGRTNQEA